MTTRNIKHILSSLIKGQVYFTKKDTWLSGKKYALGYLMYQYDIGKRKVGSSIYLTKRSEIFPLVCVGLERGEEQPGNISSNIYPLFLSENKTYILHGITFYRDGSVFPDYAFDCNTSDDRLDCLEEYWKTFHLLKIDDIFDK